MDLIAKHSPLIDKKLKAVGNAKYTSNTIQNEILECLSDMVRESIISEVKENKYFSIIVDETRDLKKKEQLSLVLRYYYNGAVHESFLDFKQATELDAEGLTQKIIQCLETYGLEYRSNLVGKVTMGPQSCQGGHSGVAARIKAKTNHAFMCNATHIVLTLFSLTQQNQCLSLKPSFLCYRNCMCTCQAPMCTRNGSLWKGNVSRCPKRATKAQWHQVGMSGTRLAKTLRTDCLLYACATWYWCGEQRRTLCGARVYLPNWILPLSEHLSSFQKSLERQNSLQTCFSQRLLI